MKWKYMFFLFATPFLISSCSEDHHEEEPDCLVQGHLTEVQLSLSVDDNLSPYRTLEIEDPTRSQRSGQSEIQYTIWAFRQEDVLLRNFNRPAYYAQTADPNPVIKLGAGKFRLIVWANYIDGNYSYYHTDRISDMLQVEKFNYRGGDHNNFAYKAEKDITVSYRPGQVDMELSGIMAQFRLLPMDEANYKVGKIELSYPYGLPASINLTTDSICHEWMEVTYQADTENLMDYILTDPSQRNLTVGISVYDESGLLRARRQALTFPIKRGGVTNVKANIFSILENGQLPNHDQDGMGINDKFNYTYWIDL